MSISFKTIGVDRTLGIEVLSNQMYGRAFCYERPDIFDCYSIDRTGRTFKNFGLARVCLRAHFLSVANTSFIPGRDLFSAYSSQTWFHEVMRDLEKREKLTHVETLQIAHRILTEGLDAKIKLESGASTTPRSLLITHGLITRNKGVTR
jgi:hypothetical protein